MKKVFLAVLFTTTCAANTTNPGNFDDWVVCNSCSQGTSILCNGYYQPLPLPQDVSDLAVGFDLGISGISGLEAGSSSAMAWLLLVAGLLVLVTMVFLSPSLMSSRFHCPIHGPQAFANTVAPTSRNVLR